MSKTIIAIIIIIIVAGLGYWIYQLTSTPEEEVVSEGNKDCVNDDDCVVFGKTGDCNRGCYNKGNLPSGSGGECFCAAPISCKCVDGKCEGVFGEEQTIRAKNDENFSVVLEANPTTGYGWQIDFNSTYIELVERNYTSGSPPGIMGSGGKETFEFLAKKSGTTEITFSYLRSWEEKEPIEKKIYEITIE